ncbi:DUF4179 domain-containing protein [Paenibacillus wulumuqiensis]|uniref:DUF4179 domain-containing protein n=1 Tax=Paenibacillus wulumuqiensis TaxID=1567107 RepID=UPI0006973541|nr:DUF4179 domain-containing protein [Paenibacillus wulumuqiensis]
MNTGVQELKDELSAQKKKKKRNWIIVGVGAACLIMLCAIIGYINNYNEHIAKIGYYMDQQDYNSAHEETAELFPQSYSRKLIERVNILYEVQRHLPSYSYSDYNSWQDRTTWEIHSLIDGLTTYEKYKQAGEEYNISESLSTLRGKYLMYLETYSISQESATKAATAATGGRDKLINELVMQAKEFEAKQSAATASTSSENSSNSSSTLSSDSSYTRDELESDPLAPSTNPDDYNSYGEYAPAGGYSIDPADYNYEGEYKPVESMTQEEKQAELEEMLGRSLGQ